MVRRQTGDRAHRSGLPVDRLPEDEDQPASGGAVLRAWPPAARADGLDRRVDGSKVGSLAGAWLTVRALARIARRACQGYNTGNQAARGPRALPRREVLIHGEAT